MIKSERPKLPTKFYSPIIASHPQQYDFQTIWKHNTISCALKKQIYSPKCINCILVNDPLFPPSWFLTIGVTEIKLGIVICVLLWEHYCKYIVKTQQGVRSCRRLCLWGMIIRFMVFLRYHNMTTQHIFDLLCNYYMLHTLVFLCLRVKCTTLMTSWILFLIYCSNDY